MKYKTEIASSASEVACRRVKCYCTWL